MLPSGTGGVSGCLDVSGYKTVTTGGISKYVSYDHQHLVAS